LFIEYYGGNGYASQYYQGLRDDMQGAVGRGAWGRGGVGWWWRLVARKKGKTIAEKRSVRALFVDGGGAFPGRHGLRVRGYYPLPLDI